jgi:heme/copper-type cytochrome/quinol oxidase subunit 2
MDDWIIFMGFLVVIALLYAIINKDKKKPFAKEMAEIKVKQKKAMKIMYWIIAIIVIIFIIFLIWAYSQPTPAQSEEHNSCIMNCVDKFMNCIKYQPSGDICTTQRTFCDNHC